VLRLLLTMDPQRDAIAPFLDDLARDPCRVLGGFSLRDDAPNEFLGSDGATAQSEWVISM